MRGLVVESIDPIGESKTIEYSPEGWPTAITHPDGTTITVLYDGEGNRIATTNEIGATTTTDYTVFDKPIAITDATGATTHLEYNTQMQPVRVTNADGNTWSYIYDLDGMPASEVDYNNIATTYTISADGLVTTLTTPAGTTTHTRHADGRTDTITDALGTTRCFYTDTKRVARIEGPQATIDYTRDTYGRVTAETVTLPSGEATTHEFSYAHAGHITEQHLTLPLGGTFTTGYRHDEAGAITATTHTHAPDGSTIAEPLAELTYGVDARGLRNQLSTGSLIRTLTSDTRGRTTADTLTALDSATDGGIRTVSSRMFTWRSDSALESVTDYLRGATTYTLDILGRATGLRRNAGPNNTPAALNDAARGEETYGFSPAGVLNIMDTPATPRITETTYSATYRVGAPRPVSRSTEQDNRVEFDGTMPTRVGRTTYTYDAAGRVTRTVTKRIGKKPLVHHFYYATGAQPIGFTTSDEPGVGYRYVYDPYGRRVAKELVDASTGDVLTRTVFAHAGDRLIAEQTTYDAWVPDSANSNDSTLGNSRTVHRVGAGHVWIHDPATGALIGQVTLTPTSNAPTDGSPAGQSHVSIYGQFMLIMADLAGAPQELVDPDTGTVGGYATQTLYGIRTWHGEHTSPLLHTGQYLDVESGWAYNRYRYYHPHAGSYNAQDPLGVTPRLASAQGYVDHAAHWVDFLGLYSYHQVDSPLGRPSGVHGPVFDNGQFFVPKFDVSMSRTPEVAETLRKGIEEGQPTLLQRTENERLKNRNRAAAIKNFVRRKGVSPDEFPYASTYQGGEGATVHGVSIFAQRQQGGMLSSFYQNNNLRDRDYFLVRLVD